MIALAIFVNSLYTINSQLLAVLSTSPHEIAWSSGCSPAEAQAIPARTRLGQLVHFQEQENHPDWEKEYFLTYAYRSRRGDLLHISGRADLVKISEGGVSVIEVKSMALFPCQLEELESSPQPFVVQTKIYAYLLHKHLSIPHTDVSPILICINIADDATRSWTLDWTPAEVESILEGYIALWRRDRASQLLDHRRRTALARLVKFPLPQIRPVQRQISDFVSEVWNDGGDALIEAPPGSGKTLAILIPCLRKSLSDGYQLFYATAKAGGRSPIRKAVSQLLPVAPALKVLFLSSVEEICNASIENNLCRDCGSFCNQSSDPIDPNLLMSFTGLIDTGRIVNAAIEHNVCSVKLAHALTNYCDMLVGDYNFVYDPDARLEMFRDPNPLNWYLLGDEAHNLPDRSRENYSSRLALPELLEMWELVEDDIWRFGYLKAVDGLRKAFSGLSEWLDLQLSMADGAELSEASFSAKQFIPLLEDVQINAGRLLVGAGDRFDSEARIALFGLIGKLDQFGRSLRIEPERCRQYIESKPQILGVRCLDPALELGEMSVRFKSVALFSGTFGNMEQFRHEIGLKNRPVAFNNFAEEHQNHNRLLVLSVPGISTSLKQRDRTAKVVARTISKFSSLSPGSVLVVFPSYEYLNKISAILEASLPRVLKQHQEMSHGDREAFRRDMNSAVSPAVGLVVAGGQLTEAEDYTGESCVGIVIVGPCLPPPDPWREALAEYWNDHGGEGHSVAYLTPAVRKVVQAAGRMLRQPEDRGVVLLIDDRFTTEPIIELLPADWQKMLTGKTQDWTARVEEFWRSDWS